MVKIIVKINEDKTTYQVVDEAYGDIPENRGELASTLVEAVSKWLYPQNTGENVSKFLVEIPVFEERMHGDVLEHKHAKDGYDYWHPASRTHKIEEPEEPNTTIVKNEQIELYDGGKLSTCGSCGKQFPNYGKGTPPKKCPTCKDKEQERPSIVQTRRLLRSWQAIQIESLPDEWQEISAQSHGDANHYKIVVKGERYGASWSGRIDIFASEPFKKGDIVNIREMCSEHKVRLVTRSGYRSFHEGIPYTREEVVPITQDVQVTVTDPENPNKGDIVKVEDVIKQRRYLVLEKASEGTTATSNLVYAIAHTKTTLKGLGRQYWADANAEATITHWNVSGGARSGRFHTTGVLAVVSEEHPLYIKKTGDIQGDECYK